MSVIASKYLALNVNRLAAGNDTLLRANNVINDDGQLRPRNGQDLISRTDKPLVGAYPATCDNFKPIKIWFYNNQLWVYFRYASTIDAIGYYDFVNAVWKANPLPAINWTPTETPQIVEADRRLILLTNNGAQVFPKLAVDQGVGSLQQTVQTTQSPAGAMKALPIDTWTLSDTTVTYNQNWLTGSAKVAYTTVWKKTNENGIDILGATGGRTLVVNGATARAVTLRIQIPQELVNNYTYSPLEASKYTLQIYRTYTSLVDGTGSAPDPGANYFLVMEIRPTAAELTAGYLSFLDIQSDFTLQDPLYTNEFELGPTQEKERPPHSTALGLYQSCVWYGNTKGLWRNFFSVQAVMDGGGGLTRNGIRTNDVIVLGDWAFEAAVGAPTTWQFQIDTTSGVASQITRVLNSTDSLIRQFNRNAYSTRFNLHSIRGPDDFIGRMYLEEQQVGAAGGNDPEYGPYVGLCRANGYTGQAPCPIAPVPKISDAVGVGYMILRIQSFGGGNRTKFRIDTTPYGGGAPDFAPGDKVNIAKINGDQSCWGQFAGLNGALGSVAVIANVAGNVYDIEFLNITSAAATYQATVGVYATYNLLGAMHAVFDVSTGGVSNAIGTRDATPHRVCYTPPHEPEVVPPLQYFDLGFSDKKIIAIKPLSDSLFVFKEDGLFRMQGYYPDFYASLFDENVILLGPDLVTQMAGSLYALTSKGVYEISEQGATRISFEVQNEIDYIIANNQANVYKNGFITCNPADQRLYLWLPDVGSIKANKCFIWDGSGWTMRDDQANCACFGSRSDAPDQMSIYTGKDYAGMWITKERRSMTMIDFCDERIEPTVASINSSTRVDLTFGSDASRPALGSDWAARFTGAVIVWDGVWASRAIVNKADLISGNTFRFSLRFPDTTVAWTTADWDADEKKYSVYLAFTKEVQYGVSVDQEEPSSRQHWTDLTILTSQPLFTSMDLGFATDVNPTETYSTSEIDGFLEGLYSFQATNLWKVKRDDPKIAEKTFKRIIPASHQRGSQIRISLRHSIAMEFFSLLGYSIRTQRGGLTIERNNNV